MNQYHLVLRSICHVFTEKVRDLFFQYTYFQIYKLKSLTGLGEELIRIGDSQFEQVNMDCVYYPSDVSAIWTWQDPQNGTPRFDLPQCWGKCTENPPVVPKSRNNWSQLVNTMSMDAGM